jgi:hypothetical protein
MALPSATVVEPTAERPRVQRRGAGRALLALAAVFVGAGCLFVGPAAGLPVPGSRACDPGAYGPLPATNAARRACAGLSALPKVPLRVEEHKDGVFKLSAPTSIDIKKPVACGAVIGGNCVYHHWQWSVSDGATAVSGCYPNDKICEVKIDPYQHWAMVYFGVDNNNEDHVFDLSNGAAPPVTKPKAAIDGAVQAVAGCATGTCTAKPLKGVTVRASGSSGSGSATTGPDGSYSIAVPEGVYTVTPSYPEHTFTPPSKRVTVGSSNATANFKTCSAISTTVNATMQRSGVARAASSVPLKGGSTKNFVRVVYTPCITGTSGTVTVAWQVRPQCQASGGSSLSHDPYTKEYWPTYWQLPKSGSGPYALDNRKHVNLNDASGALVMSITVAQGLRSATVEIYDTHGTFVRPLPNKINGAGGDMTCRPQADTLTLKPK